MKLNTQQEGFTIVETLIVLAVVSILFAVALISMLSYLHQSTFYTSLNDLQQKIQAGINQSSNGQYNISGYNCSSSSSNPIPAIGTSSSNQGTNLGCVYFGSLLWLTIGGSAMTSYPLVMNDCAGGETPPCSSGEDFVSGNGEVEVIQNASNYSFEGGLKLISFQENFSSGTVTNSTAGDILPIVYGSSAVGSQSTNLISGAVTYSLYPLSKNPTSPSSVNGAELNSTDGTLESDELCFGGSQTNQVGLVTIGDSGKTTNGGLGVTTTIQSGATCTF